METERPFLQFKCPTHRNVVQSVLEVLLATRVSAILQSGRQPGIFCQAADI